MKIYLAGPMTGIKDYNYPAFNAEAARLRALGYTVENPAQNPACDSWEGYMKQAICQLVKCDSVAFLPGWSNSRGALIERALAFDLKIPVCAANEVTDFCLGETK